MVSIEIEVVFIYMQVVFKAGFTVLPPSKQSNNNNILNFKVVAGPFTAFI